MRRPILFVLLAFLAIRLHAAERMSVLELEALLAAHSAGDTTQPQDKNTDLLAEITREDDLAPRIAQIELTERLTPATRHRLISKYKLGPLTQDVLDLIADRSALLDPPPDEIPTLPPPDFAAQRVMVHGAGAFVFQTLAHLPDFFATRVTTHFDDGPVLVGGQVLSATPGLHRVGTVRREVTFRDGREILTVLPQSERIQMWDQGMQTQGEFGPEPAIVFLDIAHGKLAFHHWEKSAAGNVAVFSYSVPAEASHYEVRTACRVSQTFRKQPAYHGEITLEPATGALLRFTLQEDAAPDDPVSGVASVIEYGPVSLGNRTYICPLRSLAFSVQQSSACNRKAREQKLSRPVVYLNRTQFTTYHRLGSEHTIVPAPVIQAGSTLPADPPVNPDSPRP